MTSPTQYKLSELISGLDAVIKGDPNCVITGVSPIQQSTPGHISFLINTSYRKYLQTTLASAVILSEADADECHQHAVVCKNPHYVYSQIAGYFAPVSPAIAGVHQTVAVGEASKIDKSASIGAHCAIGNRVTIGAGCVIAPGCVIGDDVVIGAGSHLEPSVTICHHVTIGKRVHLSSGVVIGSDGFGFASHKGAWHKVPQLGGVQIGDDVSIGANTAVDRGAIEDTIIEEGVKLDNLIQVAHNVRIGAHTIIAGCVAIAGSATIGKHCMVGGGTCFAGHVEICDNTIITGMTAVTKSITTPGMYSSGIVGAVPNLEFRKNNARFHRLENLMERVKTLEMALKEIVESK